MEHKHIKFMRNTELYQYAYSLYESLSESELMINSDVSAIVFNLIFCLMELKCRGLSERSDFVEKAELFCKKYIEQSYAAYNKPEGESKEAEFTELPEVLDQLTVEKASSKMQVKGFMDYATKLHFIPQIFHESKKDKRKSDNIPKSRIIFMKKEHSFFKKRRGEREVKKLSALPVLFKETELVESAKGGCGWIKGLQHRLLRKKKQSDAGYGLDSRLTVDIPMMGIPLPFLGFILFQIFVVEYCIDPLIWSLVPITLLTAFSFLFGLCNLPRVKSVVKFLRSEDYRVRLLQKDEKSVTKLMLLGWVIRTNFRGLYFKEYGVRLGEDFLDTGSDFVKEKFRIYAADLDNYIDIDTQEVKLRDMSYLMFSSVEELRIRITDLSQLYWGRFHSIDTLMDCDNNAERVYSMYRDNPEVLNIVTTLMSQERCSAVYCKESGF